MQDIFERAEKELTMAAMSDGECKDRQKKCQDTMFTAVNKRVPWAMFVLVVTLLAGAIGFAVIRSLAGPSASDVEKAVQRIEANDQRSQDNRVFLARLESRMEVIQSQMAQQQSTLRAQTDLLLSIREEMRKR